MTEPAAGGGDPGSRAPAKRTLDRIPDRDLAISIGVVTVGSLVPVFVSLPFAHLSLYVDRWVLLVVSAVGFGAISWAFVYGLDVDHVTFFGTAVLAPWFLVPVASLLLTGLGVGLETDALIRGDWTAYATAIVCGGVATTLLSVIVDRHGVDRARVPDRRTVAFCAGGAAVLGGVLVATRRIRSTDSAAIQDTRLEYDGERTTVVVDVDRSSDATHAIVRGPTDSVSERLGDEGRIRATLAQPELSAHPVTYEIGAGTVWQSTIDTYRHTVRGPSLSIADVGVSSASDTEAAVVAVVENEGDVGAFGRLVFRGERETKVDGAVTVDAGESVDVELTVPRRSPDSTGYLSLGLRQTDAEHDWAWVDFAEYSDR